MNHPFLAVFGLGGGEIILIGLVMCLFLPLWIAPSILCYMVLTRIPPEHRKQSPELALLLLIPFFSLIWSFFVYPRIAASLRSYFTGVGDVTVSDCGQSIAMAICICMICLLIPFVNMIAGLALLVLQIIFFVKTFELTGKIKRAQMVSAPPPLV